MKITNTFRNIVAYHPIRWKILKAKNVKLHFEKKLEMV